MIIWNLPEGTGVERGANSPLPSGLHPGQQDRPLEFLFSFAQKETRLRGRVGPTAVWEGQLTGGQPTCDAWGAAFFLY